MSRLTIAIPSKGRLKENCEAWLARCGFALSQQGGDRGYRAALEGLDADVLLLSAREIAQEVLAGNLHVGVTGEDLLNDLAGNLAREAAIIERLGFGGADVVVAVPEAWLDVASMADLDAAGAQFRARHGRRMRVATKYLSLTRRFFAARSVGEYRLVESAGATEAAPASGSAEIIVDITSTGATLKANGLKVLDDGVILKSQAALAGSLKADWSAAARATLQRLLQSVDASARAARMRRLVASGKIDAALAERLSLADVQANQGYCAVEAVADAARELCDAGLGPVSIEAVSFLFRRETPAFMTFIEKI